MNKPTHAQHCTAQVSEVVGDNPWHSQKLCMVGRL